MTAGNDSAALVTSRLVHAQERLTAPIFRAMLDRVGVADPGPLVEATPPHESTS
jgi:hypothetical protein